MPKVDRKVDPQISKEKLSTNGSHHEAISPIASVGGASPLDHRSMVPSENMHTEIFDAIAERDHEQVVFCSDKATGLKAIIGIHNTTLGPALGGVRMWTYATDREALDDGLRLSRGMTYK